MLTLKIRSARIEDAAILAAAEQTIAETPGLLVSRPSELVLESFEEKSSSFLRLAVTLSRRKTEKLSATPCWIRCV